MAKFKIGDIVSKSGYKFKITKIDPDGRHADLLGMNGQGRTFGETRFLKLWKEPKTKHRKK